MRRGPLALVALVVLTLAACSVPSRPAWWNPEPEPVAPAWQPGDPQLGVNVYWERNITDSDDVVRAKARRVLDYVVDLGANSVAFSFPLFTDGVTSDRVFAADRTPTPGQVTLAVQEAADRGLRVSLRPVLNEEVLVAEDPNAWRGSIEPTDPARWLASYTAVIRPYAEIADRDSVATFVIGTELQSLEEEPGWKGVVTTLQAAFPGELRYSMAYNDFVHNARQAPALPAMLDAYPPMPLDDDASVDEVTAAWRLWLVQIAADLRPTLVLSEVGIAAQDGAFRHPATWGSDAHALNLQVQRTWYESVCRAAQDLDLAGLYWWYLNFDTDPAAAQPTPLDRMGFVGRPAEQAIRDCFGDWR